MQNDEPEIRDLVNAWLAASKEGDLTTLRDLMANDVVFMVPRKEPFGKETFMASGCATARQHRRRCIVSRGVCVPAFSPSTVHRDAQ